MATFTDWDQLTNHLNKELLKTLPKIAGRISRTLKKYVSDNWYKSSKPQMYERTMDVLNSITVGEVAQEGGNYTIEIFFDTDKIVRKTSTFEVPGNLPRFHHHMDIRGNTTYGGASIAEWVVSWMNYGQGSSLHSYGGSEFLEDTMKFTEQDRTDAKVLKQALKGNGIEVEII